MHAKLQMLGACFLTLDLISSMVKTFDDDIVDMKSGSTLISLRAHLSSISRSSPTFDMCLSTRGPMQHERPCRPNWPFDLLQAMDHDSPYQHVWISACSTDCSLISCHSRNGECLYMLWNHPSSPSLLSRLLTSVSGCSSYHPKATVLCIIHQMSDLLGSHGPMMVNA